MENIFGEVKTVKKEKVIELLESYYNDLKIALEEKYNLLAIKYGFMEETVDPAHFQIIKEVINMMLTNDQYEGLSKLEKWYHKYSHQFIEISGVIGTGAWDLIQKFISNEEFDMREVMYLSYNQKQVLELAHAEHINQI